MRPKNHINLSNSHNFGYHWHVITAADNGVILLNKVCSQYSRKFTQTKTPNFLRLAPTVKVTAPFRWLLDWTITVFLRKKAILTEFECWAEKTLNGSNNWTKIILSCISRLLPAETVCSRLSVTEENKRVQWEPLVGFPGVHDRRPQKFNPEVWAETTVPEIWGAPP